MFEPLDATQKETPVEDPVTLAEGLGVYALVLGLAFGSLFAFISLGDQPYGIQFATLISYSGAVFIWTFFRTRGVRTKHSLSARYVREELPRLLMIHCAFFIAIFSLETWALDVRSSMPSWWLTAQGRKGMPPFDFALMLLVMGTAISEVFILRRILGRAKKRFVANSTQSLSGS